MKNTLKTTLIVIAIFATSTAYAGSDSIMTLGIGTSMGVTQQTPYGGTAQAAFTNDLTVRARMLHIFGVEMAYSPTDRMETTSELVFTGQFRASALLYVIPTSPVALYLKAGIGAESLGDVFKIDAPSNSYHAGAGLDVQLGDHFVLGTEFLLLAPGITSVKNTLKNFAEQELNRYQMEGAEATAAAPKTPSIGDFLSASNFRVGVTAHYYF
jgi:hypothetical protein